MNLQDGIWSKGTKMDYCISKLTLSLPLHHWPAQHYIKFRF
jgi:hypothetical protein